MSATGDEDPMDLADDLFGDEEEDEEEVQEKARELDDEELDSGDDENRADRNAQRVADAVDDDDDVEMKEIIVFEANVARHQIPKPSDGEINSLRVPNFLSIAPKPFNPEKYKIPTTDHHSLTRSENFSACEHAATTIRYRKNPVTGKLESNTLLYRWSDGSTTLQVGDQHYEIDTKQLSQPKNAKYKPEYDSNTYLASAEIQPGILQIVGHMSNQLTVRPNKDLEDDALERLQSSMAAATRGRHAGDTKTNMVETTQDPELQKKRAEAAEKERMKLQRRRETAAARATQQVSRGPRAAAGGLSIGDLEGRTTAKKPTKNRPRRDRYDDSDDDLPHGRGARGNQDEYDREDDFLASSDEEEEEQVEEDDDDEEMIDDDSGKDEPKSKGGNKSKEKEVDSDVDADGEADTDVPGAVAAETTASRGKRRNVIEDDDDE